MNKIQELIREITAIAYHMDKTDSVELRKQNGSDIKMDDIKFKLDQLSSLIDNELSENEKQRETVQVAVVSVIENEFNALDDLFGFTKNGDEVNVGNGLRGYRCRFSQKVNKGRNLELLFVKLDRAGNLASYVITDLIFQAYQFEICILCGIAAGNDKETSIYSGVIASHVIYYESQKLKTGENKNKDRFEPVPIHKYLSREIDNMVYKSNNWKEYFLSVLKRNNVSIAPEEVAGYTWIDENWQDNLSLKTGGIMAGEKLLADKNFLEKLVERNQIGKTIVAGEMEGYGFAYACAENDFTRWLVFRGISDFGGDEKSSNLNEKYQFVAGYSAATMVYYYLENIYTKSDRAS